MPEGHTIAALASMWEKYVGEHFAITSPTGRVAGTERVDGRVLEHALSTGKHLFLGFDGDVWLHVHLGRCGSFHWHFGEPQVNALTLGAANARLRLVGESVWVELVGPLVCEVVDGAGKALIEEKLGADPLHVDDPGERAFERINASRRPIGILLMDQSVVAGLGNIYRAELLWRNRVSPWRPGSMIDDDVFDELWVDARYLLADGMLNYMPGEPTHTAHLPLPDGSVASPEGGGARGNLTQVYDREGLSCARCGTAIVRENLGGRAIFYCPTCQVD